MRTLVSTVVLAIVLCFAGTSIAQATPPAPTPPGTFWRGDGVNNSSTTLSLKNAELFIASEGPSAYPDPRDNWNVWYTNGLVWFATMEYYYFGQHTQPYYNAYWTSTSGTVRVNNTVVNAEVRVYNPWTRTACIIKGTVTGTDVNMRYNLNNGPTAHQEGCYYF